MIFNIYIYIYINFSDDTLYKIDKKNYQFVTRLEAQLTEQDYVTHPTPLSFLLVVLVKDDRSNFQIWLYAGPKHVCYAQLYFSEFEGCRKQVK